MMNRDTDWQTTCRSAKERGKYLRKTAQWSDCYFHVGTEADSTVFAAHKLMLSMASPVFDAMFNGGLAEKINPIKVLDVQPDAFAAMLDFIYTESVDLKDSMVMAGDLCYAAKKYILPDLEKQCFAFMWSNLSPKNVCRAFECAKQFDDANLVERCLEVRILIYRHLK